MEHEGRLDPPEVCRLCGIYHAYREGICYECIIANEEIKAEEKINNYYLRRSERKL